MGKTHKHLSCEKRTMIHLSLEQGCALRVIAQSAQRVQRSFSRELRRNGWSNPAMAPKKRGRPPIAGGYRAPLAQQRADELRRPSRLTMNGPQWGHVERLLPERRSPEQIAGILRRMNSDQASLQVSHETIYTALYTMPHGTMRTKLIACLHQARKSRLPRARGEDRRGTIPNMISIHLRPPEVNERVIPGHWEGNPIKCPRNTSSNCTLVERTKLFVTLAKVKDATFDTAVTAFSSALNRIDSQRHLPMTYVQGRKMAQHERLSEITGVAVYFADPHSPRQRGINENTNGLLRQYSAKGSDLSAFSHDELDAVACQLNTRSRKSLNFKCPAELSMPESFDFFKHHQLVALQT